MDNQNKPNFPNSTPAQPSPAPAWPPAPQDPTPIWTPPVQAPPEPTSSWTPTATSTTPTLPSTAPVWPTPQVTPTPIQSGPTPDASSPTWPTPQPTASSWTPPVQTPPQSEPAPTFTPPAVPAPTSSLSPLDNPWGSPAQPPPPPMQPTQPSWMGVNTNTAPTESIPTDLSHLISNNDSSQQQPTQSVPENLVVLSTPTPTPDVPTLPTQDHKSIPKLIIGLGVGLLILVLGASAYFILGIGQPAQETTSIPATTAPQAAQVKPPAPIATTTPAVTPRPAEQSTASSSANFGELGGSVNASPAATSAAELLRQGQPRR